MSDTKEIGVIGQIYEDRKSGKIGELVSRDKVRKTLMLKGPDEKGFIISYSTFRSNWRKAKTDVVDSPTDTAVIEQPVTTPTVTPEDVFEVVSKFFSNVKSTNQYKVNKMDNYVEVRIIDSIVDKVLMEIDLSATTDYVIRMMTDVVLKAGREFFDAPTLSLGYVWDEEKSLNAVLKVTNDSLACVLSSMEYVFTDLQLITDEHIIANLTNDNKESEEN